MGTGWSARFMTRPLARGHGRRTGLSRVPGGVQGRTGAYRFRALISICARSWPLPRGLDRGKNDNMSEDMARARPEHDPATSLTGPEPFEDVLDGVKALLSR